MSRAWQVRVDEVPNGARYEISREGRKLTLRDVFSLLETCSQFAGWYTNLLAGSPLDAFFWEHPPVRSETFDRPAEFVLLDAPQLALRRPDSRAFEAELARGSDPDVSVFPNLAGDALLIAPKPAGPTEVYGHLASFLRGCSPLQVRSFWQSTGRAVREGVRADPVWVSTAGMGVAWLHVRIDSSPKYYRFEPYKTFPR